MHTIKSATKITFTNAHTYQKSNQVVVRLSVYNLLCHILAPYSSHYSVHNLFDISGCLVWYKVSPTTHTNALHNALSIVIQTTENTYLLILNSPQLRH